MRIANKMNRRTNGRHQIRTPNFEKQSIWFLSLNFRKFNLEVMFFSNKQPFVFLEKTSENFKNVFFSMI